ncbi:MAG TPA: hypothetical protein VHB45_00315 [Alloacidobacterium sp.]|nr:hypothetical protein [Alloacidobacterium sp.]
MKHRLTITPHAGNPEGFEYVVELSRSETPQSVEQKTSFGQLADVETALREAGAGELADMAGKSLELGNQFVHVVELSDEQRSTLMKPK